MCGSENRNNEDATNWSHWFCHPVPTLVRWSSTDWGLEWHFVVMAVIGSQSRVIKLTDCCWSRDWSNNKETAAVSPDKTKIAALCRSELTPYGSCVVNLYSAEDGKLVMQLMEGNRCAVSFVDNCHVLCGEVHELQVMNINSGETRKRLCCPRQLHLRSSPHRVTTMEFVASFQSPSHDGEKLMGFRLHNIS